MPIQHGLVESLLFLAREAQGDGRDEDAQILCHAIAQLSESHSIMDQKVLAFPMRSAADFLDTPAAEPREKVARAIQNCLSAVAAEAEDEGFPLAAEALHLAIAILSSEAKAAAATEADRLSGSSGRGQ